MKTKLIAGLSGVVLGLIATSVLACGESLFRVGKGVEFRQYTAPLPGSILAVANSEAELMLMQQLAAAGHDVHVVADPSQIRDGLAQYKVDIVLSWYSQRDDVATQIAGSSVTYIPVAMHDTDEERAARRDFQTTLSSDDSVKTFLKTIHRTLKASG